MSIIAPYDRMALQTRFRNAEPFRFFVVDDFLRREFADELAASFPRYEHADAYRANVLDVRRVGA